MTEFSLTPFELPTEISFPAAAVEKKKELLAEAGLVVAVKNAGQNATQSDIVGRILAWVKEIEADALEIRRPLTAMHGKVCALEQAFVKELKEEAWRLGQLAEPWVQLEVARQKNEETLKRQDLTDVERERLEAELKATTLDEKQAVREEYQMRAAVVSARPLAPPGIAKNQKPKWVWKFTATNLLEVAKFAPDCVAMELKARETTDKLIMLAGVPDKDKTYTGIPGLVATSVFECKPRATKPGKVVEV